MTATKIEWQEKKTFECASGSVSMTGTGSASTLLIPHNIEAPYTVMLTSKTEDALNAQYYVFSDPSNLVTLEPVNTPPIGADVVINFMIIKD
jgi:hypothetical protein